MMLGILISRDDWTAGMRSHLVLGIHQTLQSVSQETPIVPDVASRRVAVHTGWGTAASCAVTHVCGATLA